MSRVAMSAGPIAIEIEDEDETSETLAQMALETLESVLTQVEVLGGEDKDG